MGLIRFTDEDTCTKLIRDLIEALWRADRATQLCFWRGARIDCEIARRLLRGLASVLDECHRNRCVSDDLFREFREEISATLTKVEERLR